MYLFSPNLSETGFPNNKKWSPKLKVVMSSIFSKEKSMMLMSKIILVVNDYNLYQNSYFSENTHWFTTTKCQRQNHYVSFSFRQNNKKLTKKRMFQLSKRCKKSRFLVLNLLNIESLGPILIILVRSTCFNKIYYFLILPKLTLVLLNFSFFPTLNYNKSSQTPFSVELKQW